MYTYTYRIYLLAQNIYKFITYMYEKKGRRERPRKREREREREREGEKHRRNRGKEGQKEFGRQREAKGRIM